MSFKTTKNRTHLRIVREVEAIGGNVLASGAQPAALSRRLRDCTLARSDRTALRQPKRTD